MTQCHQWWSGKQWRKQNKSQKDKQDGTQKHMACHLNFLFLNNKFVVNKLKLKLEHVFVSYTFKLWNKL